MLNMMESFTLFGNRTLPYILMDWMEQIVDCIDINGDMHIMDRLVNEIVQSSQGSTSDHVSINDVQKANVTHVEESQYDIILVFDTQGVCSSLVVPYKSRGTHNQ